jgi:hypothetical protein
LTSLPAAFFAGTFFGAAFFTTTGADFTAASQPCYNRPTAPL